MRMSINRPILVVAALALVAGWGLGSTAAQEVYSVSDGVLLEADEDGAYLGVRLVEETELQAGGARVTHVVDDSPADTAGLREDDIVVGFDGEVIRGPVALTKRIHGREAGDRVSLEIVREGKKIDLQVELGRRAGVSAFVPEVAWDSERWGEWQEQLGEQLEKLEGSYSFTVPEFSGDLRAPLSLYRSRPVLGVELVETTPELREHLGGSEDEGVLVSKVLVATPAARSGIAVGDLILRVDGGSVASVSELREALSDKTGETFPVVVMREDRRVTVQVTIPAPDKDRPTGPRA